MGPLTPIIHTLLQDLGQGVKEKRSLLQSGWPRIMGNSFSAHTKPLLQEGGTLCVWVDDSTLAYELSQKYQGTILKRVEGALGEGTVKRMIFRVGSIDSRKKAAS